jgi:hypothetical protein
MTRLTVLLALLAGALSSTTAAPLKAILVGQPGAVQSILESGGLFQVEVAAAQGQPALEKYKLVILSGGDALPMSSLAALDKYLMSGGGMVALAGSGNGFPNSPEFGLMLGVTAASNRDRSAGPLWFYQDGNIAFDGTTAEPAGKAIPPDTPFLVTIRNTEHPITKGLPLEWMHLSDELVGNLRGPAKNMALLATAFSDGPKGGTGRHEPQIVAVTYGKGRIFHSILGRTPAALECAGLQTMLQRGAEWAATGRVTQKIPTDFPDEGKVSRRAK